MNKEKIADLITFDPILGPMMKKIFSDFVISKLPAEQIDALAEEFEKQFNQEFQKLENSKMDEHTTILAVLLNYFRKNENFDMV